MFMLSIYTLANDTLSTLVHRVAPYAYAVTTADAVAAHTVLCSAVQISANLSAPLRLRSSQCISAGFQHIVSW